MSELPKGGPTCRGIPGRHGAESVAGLRRNQWPASGGIRTGVSALAHQHFEKHLELLRDLANYGANLVLRSFNSSPKKMEDIVICGVLLKQVVAMTDAIEILLTAGCGLAALLPSRTAFEASIYLDWILVPDSELKAKRYIVSNYRDQREWAKRATLGSPEELELRKAIEPFKINIHATRPELAATAAAAVAEADRVLAQPSLSSIDQEFVAARRKNQRYDIEWYQLDGLRSIRQVAEKVDRLAEYELFYSRGSQVMHTGTYKDHVGPRRVFRRAPGLSPGCQSQTLLLMICTSLDPI